MKTIIKLFLIVITMSWATSMITYRFFSPLENKSYEKVDVIKTNNNQFEMKFFKDDVDEENEKESPCGAFMFTGSFIDLYELTTPDIEDSYKVKLEKPDRSISASPADKKIFATLVGVDTFTYKELYIVSQLKLSEFQTRLGTRIRQNSDGLKIVNESNGKTVYYPLNDHKGPSLFFSFISQKRFTRKSK
jgi:hypothetical protein